MQGCLFWAQEISAFEGSEYVIETNHQALLALCDKDTKSEEFLKFALKLQGAGSCLTYCKGEGNPVDALSRLAVAETKTALAEKRKRIKMLTFTLCLFCGHCSKV